MVPTPLFCQRWVSPRPDSPGQLKLILRLLALKATENGSDRLDEEDANHAVEFGGVASIPEPRKWAKGDRLLFLDGEVDSWLVHGYIFLHIISYSQSMLTWVLAWAVKVHSKIRDKRNRIALSNSAGISHASCAETSHGPFTCVLWIQASNTTEPLVVWQFEPSPPPFTTPTRGGRPNHSDSPFRKAPHSWCICGKSCNLRWRKAIFCSWGSVLSGFQMGHKFPNSETKRSLLRA